ncbi:MAG: hypothetical protein L3K03_00650 [Thermoplasmata archaeon]|nr:hypothetical protein [Thermoplasmata archaeon]
MPDPTPKWPLRALRLLLPILGLALAAQYLAGLWTSAYAPAAGFTSSSAMSFQPLQVHYALGVLLGLGTLALVVVAAFTRRIPYLILSIVALLGVGAAGIFGELFVRSTPNDPAYSVLMGIAFLVAFWALMLLAILTIMGRRMVPLLPAATPAA